MRQMVSPILNIIVPCYNSSEYLSRCLDSLLSSSVSDLEFLIIDDGSTDATAEIINSYCTKDSRFRVIHKQNGGYPSAINRGLDECKGTYVMFLGSDDELDPLLFEQIKSVAEAKPDAIAFRTKIVSADGSIYSDSATAAITHSFIFAGSYHQLEQSHPNESIIFCTRDTSRCFRREVIGNNREHGRYGIHADGTFSILVSLSCSSFAFIPFDGYIWHRRPNSVSGSMPSDQQVLDITGNWIYFFQQLRLRHKPDEFVEPIYSCSNFLRDYIYDSACTHLRGKMRFSRRARKEYYAFCRFAHYRPQLSWKAKMRLHWPRLYRVAYNLNKKRKEILKP